MNKKYAIGSAIIFSFISVLPCEARTYKWNNYSDYKGVNLLDSSHVYDLDEVYVISHPKDMFRLRQQSSSSSCYSAKDMNALAVHDLRELSVYVPSFIMPNYGTRYTSSMYVRGIGSRVNSPAVGIYMDDMPLLSKSAFNHHIYQLQMIDVLRGPQGTLYGQNSEGGIIRMYTINPMNYQGTDINLGAGSHGYRNIEISHYNKFSDKFALSLAGFYNGQNGFFRNSNTGERADSYNEAGGRLKLVWRPDSRWDINYTADYQYTHQNGFPYGLLNTETGETSSPSTTYQGNYHRNMFNTALHLKFHASYVDFFSTTSYQYLNDYMLMDLDYMPEDYMYMTQKQLQNSISQEFVWKSNRKSFWHWTSGAFFSYEWTKTDAPVYFCNGITRPISNAIQTAMYKAMVSSMASKMMQMGISALAAQDAAKAAIEKAGGISMSVTMGAPGVYHTPQFNLGFYHESNFNITDRLVGTLGLRFDYEHAKVFYNTSAYMNMTANVMGKEASYTLSSMLNEFTKNDYNQLLPKFGINYKIDTLGSNLYATISKGYRAGGFNIQMFSDILQTELNKNAYKAYRGNYEVTHTSDDYAKIKKTIEYKPETSWNYEIGTHLNLFNNTIHWDLAAFYMQVRNQQLSVMASNYGFGRMMVNAGKSHSCGIETTLKGNAINNHLAWTLSYSYTHAAFDDYTDSIMVKGTYKKVDYNKKKVPYVPQHILSAMADYTFDIQHSALKSITLGANMNAQGKIYWDEANTYSQKFYAVTGAHIDADFGRVKVSLWGKNLTNTKYNTFSVSSSATGTKEYFAQQANPIQVGIDAKIHL